MNRIALVDETLLERQLQHMQHRRAMLARELTEHEKMLRKVEDELSAATKCYEQNIQEVFAELVRLRLATAKECARKRMEPSCPEASRVFRCKEKRQELDLRALYYATALLLFENGACRAPMVFDAAAKAFKQKDFHTLYRCYDQALAALTVSRGATTKKRSVHEQIKAEQRNCAYLAYAIETVLKKISRVTSHRLFLAYKAGPETFASLCEEAIAVMSFEVEALRERLSSR